MTVFLSCPCTFLLWVNYKLFLKISLIAILTRTRKATAGVPNFARTSVASGNILTLSISVTWVCQALINICEIHFMNKQYAHLMKVDRDLNIMRQIHSLNIMNIQNLMLFLVSTGPCPSQWTKASPVNTSKRFPFISFCTHPCHPLVADLCRSLDVHKLYGSMSWLQHILRPERASYDGPWRKHKSLTSTDKTISGKASFTLANESTKCVRTICICVAWTIHCTFIDV